MNTVIQWFVIGYFMMVGIKVARKVNFIKASTIKEAECDLNYVDINN